MQKKYMNLFIALKNLTNLCIIPCFGLSMYFRCGIKNILRIYGKAINLKILL